MNQKGFANIILIILVLALVGSVGYLTLIKRSIPSSEVTTQTPTPTPSPTSTSQPAQSSTTVQNNMQRYQSILGFHIDYPKNWRFSPWIDRYTTIAQAQSVGGNHFSIYSYPENTYLPGAPVPSNEVKIEVWVYDNISTVSLDKWIDSFGDIQDILKTETMTIGGGAAKEILYSTDGPAGTVLAVFYLSGNKGAAFYSVPSDTQYSQEFNNIVKTFSFDR